MQVLPTEITLGGRGRAGENSEHRAEFSYPRQPNRVRGHGVHAAIRLDRPEMRA